MATISLKSPPDEKQTAVLVQELPRYKAIVEYVAQFVYMRQSMGDMDGKEVMDEFTKNVTEVMKEATMGGPPTDDQH